MDGVDRGGVGPDCEEDYRLKAEFVLAAFWLACRIFCSSARGVGRGRAPGAAWSFLGGRARNPDISLKTAEGGTANLR